MLLYGFIVGAKGGDVLNNGWKIFFGGVLIVSLISFLLIVTGYWDRFRYYFFDYGSGFLFS